MMLSTLLKPAIVVNGKKYKVMNQIGEGAFGYVYHVKSVQANDKGESYALKKVICQTDEQMIEAKKEMDVMLKIQDSRVVPLLNFSYLRNKKGQDEVYMVMPLYHSSVQSVIDGGPGYPYCSFNDGLDVVKILRHSIEGLLALHEAGFRHGDFKPANILLSETFDAVITDFGSTSPLTTIVSNRSKALEVQEQAASHSTASYRAPELFSTPNDCTIDGKADMWAFGCTMFCLMFSRTPFETSIEGLSTLSVMSSQYSIPEDCPWPDDYIDLIKHCLQVETSQRIVPLEVQTALKRLSGPPLDLHRRVKMPPVSSPVSVVESVSPASSSGEQSPATATMDVNQGREKIEAASNPPLADVSPTTADADSCYVAVDFANFDSQTTISSNGITSESLQPVDDVNALPADHVARESSIGDFASSSLSFSGGKRDSWGGISHSNHHETHLSAVLQENEEEYALEEKEEEEGTNHHLSDSSHHSNSSHPEEKTMSTSPSSGMDDGTITNRSFSSSYVVAEMHSSTATFSTLRDDFNSDSDLRRDGIADQCNDSVNDSRDSTQPATSPVNDHRNDRHDHKTAVRSAAEGENEADDDDDDDEEFGDFTSDTVSAPASSTSAVTAAVSTTVKHSLPPSIHNSSQQQQQQQQQQEHESSMVLDFHQRVLEEANDPKNILKEGKIYIHRLGGFPKKMMRKEVWMVVTASGLIVQKMRDTKTNKNHKGMGSQTSSSSPKIHDIFTFYQPLSLTPSDTLAIGLNGLLINGFSPVSLSPTLVSHPSTPSSTASAVVEDSDWVHIDLSPKASSSSSTAAASTASINNHNTDSGILGNHSSRLSGQRIKSRFVPCRLEIAFGDKDELNDWMDVIWQQFETIRDQPI